MCDPMKQTPCPKCRRLYDHPDAFMDLRGQMVCRVCKLDDPKEKAEWEVKRKAELVELRKREALRNAAPDLLKALKRLSCLVMMTNDPESAWYQAQEAINKAEGRK